MPLGLTNNVAINRISRHRLLEQSENYPDISRLQDSSHWRSPLNWERGVDPTFSVMQVVIWTLERNALTARGMLGWAPCKAW